MTLPREKRELLRKYVIENVGDHSNDIVGRTTAEFGVTKQAVHQHIRKLIAENILESSGRGRNLVYCLKSTEHRFELPVTPQMAENTVWQETVRPVLPELPANVLDICSYGFSEMLNNVISHSQSADVVLVARYDALGVGFDVVDHGAGIFKKIQEDFKLESPKHAILELAKGKLTSDPAHHTGEGVFFTSRMFDEFDIVSGNLHFQVRAGKDWLFESRTNAVQGTAVTMRIRRNSARNMKEVFDKYAADKDDFGFSRTVVPVRLMEFEGEALISRSQAKRLITRFDRFKEVILDFEGVKLIGQAFADEVFRVFKGQNPDVHLTWVNSVKDVEGMIKHVLNNR